MSNSHAPADVVVDEEQGVSGTLDIGLLPASGISHQDVGVPGSMPSASNEAKLPGPDQAGGLDVEPQFHSVASSPVDTIVAQQLPALDGDKELSQPVLDTVQVETTAIAPEPTNEPPRSPTSPRVVDSPQRDMPPRSPSPTAPVIEHPARCDGCGVRVYG